MKSRSPISNHTYEANAAWRANMPDGGQLRCNAQFLFDQTEFRHDRGEADDSFRQCTRKTVK
jgi:hypothetical protein